MSPGKFPSILKKNKKEKKTQAKKGVLAIEKRKHPRFFVELPLDYSRKGKNPDFGGLIKNASEGGILVYLPEKLDVGELLKIDIFFAKGLELNSIQGVAKIVWSDLAARETWKEHRYGLEFHSMPKGTIQKLRNLLKDVGKTHKS
ncbi:MAG: PilZ domain-containing protein [Thermodesulfobacteriota bacterium]|nr:PilZ domain-containing protein [Thermodesulfobacteriota bacterium]